MFVRFLLSEQSLKPNTRHEHKENEDCTTMETATLLVSADVRTELN